MSSLSLWSCQDCGNHVEIFFPLCLVLGCISNWLAMYCCNQRVCLQILDNFPDKITKRKCVTTSARMSDVLWFQHVTYCCRSTWVNWSVWSTRQSRSEWSARPAWTQGSYRMDWATGSTRSIWTCGTYWYVDHSFFVILSRLHSEFCRHSSVNCTCFS